MIDKKHNMTHIKYVYIIKFLYFKVNINLLLIEIKVYFVIFDIRKSHDLFKFSLKNIFERYSKYYFYSDIVFTAF